MVNMISQIHEFSLENLLSSLTRGYTHFVNSDTGEFWRNQFTVDGGIGLIQHLVLVRGTAEWFSGSS
jgi:hypothetical protein